MDSSHSLPRSSKIILISAFAIALACLVATGLMWSKLQKLKAANAPTGEAAEVAKIVDKIGGLLTLPQDEEPTLLTVTELESLAGQPFFANALVGDKVLIYTKNSKAVLWRPTTEKIIEASIINISQQ